MVTVDPGIDHVRVDVRDRADAVAGASRAQIGFDAVDAVRQSLSDRPHLAIDLDVIDVGFALERRYLLRREVRGETGERRAVNPGWLKSESRREPADCLDDAGIGVSEICDVRQPR